MLGLFDGSIPFLKGSQFGFLFSNNSTKSQTFITKKFKIVFRTTNYMIKMWSILSKWTNATILIILLIWINIKRKFLFLGKKQKKNFKNIKNIKNIRKIALLLFGTQSKPSKFNIICLILVCIPYMIPN